MEVISRRYCPTQHYPREKSCTQWVFAIAGLDAVAILEPQPVRDATLNTAFHNTNPDTEFGSP
jgi:hypothetical protein